MKLNLDRVPALVGPLIVAAAVASLCAYEFEVSVRWAVVIGLFVAVQLQRFHLL